MALADMLTNMPAAVSQHKIGFTCGAFDLLHYGHALMLEECRRHCDTLIVGVQHDPSLYWPGKNKPVQSLDERIGMLRAMRWVGAVFSYDGEDALVELMRAVAPHVRFMGEDWRDKPITGAKLKIPIHYTSRAHGFSTSELRRRVAAAQKELA